MTTEINSSKPKFGEIHPKTLAGEATHQTMGKLSAAAKYPQGLSAI
jgi:hypothetical protein